ncbi:MAG: S8 family serine peptidase [Chloroflexota bacterium]
MLKRVVGLLALVSLILTSTSTSASVKPSPVSEQSDSAETMYSKIHPNLQRDIDQALQVSNGPSLRSAPVSTGIPFVARIKDGTSLDVYTDQWFTRPFVDPLGNTVAVGIAEATNLLKIASEADVLSLQRPESLVDVPQPADPELDRMLNANIPEEIDVSTTSGPAPDGWYHTGSTIHGSQAAWDKGYTGAGVRLMSNDSGADYCHPDLLGTWAYIDNPDSPYYGLPQMFDSYSSYLASQDYYLETSTVADGGTDYADTSTTFKRAPSWVWNRLPASEHTVTYQPIGAEEERTYVLPGTSRSGFYKIGSHPDKALAARANVLSTQFGDGTAVLGERAAVVVVDSDKSEIYDTVYVDLNYNFDFTDDIPARIYRGTEPVDPRERTGYHEAACLDFNDDELNDVSGGLVYFIADGETAIPTLDWYWGVPGDAYGNGDLVAFHVMDYTEGGGTHGMGTTSSAVGQGVVSGSTIAGPDGPPQANGQGLVVGPGKDVATTQNGDFYLSPFVEDGFIYSALGYDGVSGTDDDVQIVSNSWSSSGTFNDGFDDNSRLLDYINRTMAPNAAFLFSTGNRGPGYGTMGPPKPPSGIGVAATTLFGSLGRFETIASEDQIVSGDIINWSNRGPGVNNDVGADVAATGAFGTGSTALNLLLNGSTATGLFGGTSQATPVAAGNLALMYQAWYERTGAWPTFSEAKAMLMGSATNIDHDAWSQGAGMVNADIGTNMAAGLDNIYATPFEWSAGDYRGEEYPAFANIISPGDSDTQTFTLWNHSDTAQEVSITSNQFEKIGTEDYSFTSLDQSLNHGFFTIPDYVFRIDEDIPEGTDLIKVRLTTPYDKFDPDDDLLPPYNSWHVLLYNWTDHDGDGEFWVDADDNGKVSLERDDEGAVIGSEMDAEEYIRFNYGYLEGPTQQIRVNNPRERMDDGVLLGFRHQGRRTDISVTDLTVEVTFWQRAEWDWITLDQSERTISPDSRNTFDATIDVPEETPYGMYGGSIIVDDDNNETVIPVTIAVAANGTQFNFGDVDQSNMLYDNGSVFGYTSYSGRADGGDWRFFWTDVTTDDVPESGTPYLVVDTSWAGENTDIDTIVLGPTPSILPPNVADGEEGVPFPPDIYGPYTLGIVNQSVNTFTSSGRWPFQTATGGPRELIAAPANEGLHGILLHNVKVDGNVMNERFSGSTGLVTIDPGVVTLDSDTGSTSISMTSELAFDGFEATTFGMSKPDITRETAQQDDASDPTSASIQTDVELTDAASLNVTTSDLSTIANLDLFVFDAEGNVVASATTSSGEEEISLTFPDDGTYTIAVLGENVPSDGVDFDMAITAVQGDDLVVSNLPDDIPDTGTITMDLDWDIAGKEEGTYTGIILMGPEVAPTLFSVPVEVTVE